jgi:uncharacterized protein YndB with AHSA1/START domain
MEFEFNIVINRPPADVFAFFRDKDQHPRGDSSPVTVLEKTTSGPYGVGTRYREVVRMLPFMEGEILSEITRFEPPAHLEEKWWSSGMEGELAYHFESTGESTRLTQRETLRPKGLLKLFSPMIKLMFGRAATNRLAIIKEYLEGSPKSS